DDLERAVGGHVELLFVQGRPRAATTLAAEPAGVERVEADPARLTACAPDPVVVPTGDRGPEIEVVRVLRHDLDRLVARADQRGTSRVAVLEPALERTAHHPGEHPIALGDVERIIDTLSQHLVTR